MVLSSSPKYYEMLEVKVLLNFIQGVDGQKSHKKMFAKLERKTQEYVAVQDGHVSLNNIHPLVQIISLTGHDPG